MRRPTRSSITGNMHADANHEHNNATTTFWRAAEGISIASAGGTMQWAVSQAVSLRRMHARRLWCCTSIMGGERRLDVGFAGGRECRFREPAAVDLAQLRVEELDRLRTGTWCLLA